MIAADVTGTTDYTNSTAALHMGIATETEAPGSTGDIRRGTINEFDVLAGTRSLAPLKAGAAARQGLMFSFVAAGGAAGAQTFAIRGSAGNNNHLTAAYPIPAGAQTHLSGLIEGSWRASADAGAGTAPAVLGATNRLGGAVRGNNLFVDSTDATHVVTRPALGVIYSSTQFADPLSLTTVLPVDRPMTYLPGCAKGFYITVPLGDANLASGQTDATVRRITCPIKIKLHEVCFSSAVSGASNTVQIVNITQGVNITGEIALTGATASTVAVGAASLTNRTINKGDIIELQATTVGTGFTALAAMLTGHTLDHFHVSSPHLDTICSVPQTTEPASVFRNQSGSWIGRTNFSGPVRGGPAIFQLPVQFTIGTGLTDFAVSRVIAPFDCAAFGYQLSYRASATGNSFRFYNITKAADIVAAVSAVSGTQANVSAVTAGSVAITKGDVVELRVTTGGTAGFAAIGGSLTVHVRGHVNTNPALD